MRIAKPLLLTLTPIGVVWGLVEAWRFRPILALLMGLLLGVVSLFIWMTVRRIRLEQRILGPRTLEPPILERQVKDDRPGG